jgi:hypothetical protein
MNKTDIFQKIKDLVSNVKFDATPVSEESAPVELMKVTDASGNEYELEALEVGKVLSMGGVPVPAGEYTVSEGATVITCGEGGVITEISEAKSETTEAEPIAEVAHVSIEKLEQMIADATNQIKVEHQKQIDSLQAIISDNAKGVSLAFEATKKAIEVVANIPDSEPIHVEHGKVITTKTDKQQAREALGEAFSKFTNK